MCRPALNSLPKACFACGFEKSQEAAERRLLGRVHRAAEKLPGLQMRFVARQRVAGRDRRNGPPPRRWEALAADPISQSTYLGRAAQ